MKDSNNFATVDYDAHKITKIDYSITHLIISISIPELITIHHICELERTKLLTIIAMCVQNPQSTGYLLTENVAFFSM